MESLIVELPERKMIGLGMRFISALSLDRNNMELILALWNQYLQRCH